MAVEGISRGDSVGDSAGPWAEDSKKGRSKSRKEKKKIIGKKTKSEDRVVGGIRIGGDEG